MWTLVRFALTDAAEDGYRDAYDILARAGFQPYRAPAASEVLPAAVVADLLQDPAVVSRAIFEALSAGGLGPMMVTGCQVGPGADRRGDRALAHG
jgi:hypothetical protein